jgi:hypothetical protein
MQEHPSPEEGWVECETIPSASHPRSPILRAAEAKFSVEYCLATAILRESPRDLRMSGCRTKFAVFFSRRQQPTTCSKAGICACVSNCAWPALEKEGLASGHHRLGGSCGQASRLPGRDSPGDQIEQSLHMIQELKSQEYFQSHRDFDPK